MSVPSAAVPQLVFNGVVVLALLAYLPRAVRLHKNRFAAVVLLVIFAAAAWANLHGWVLRGPIQGGGAHHA